MWARVVSAVFVRAAKRVHPFSPIPLGEVVLDPSDVPLANDVAVVAPLIAEPAVGVDGPTFFVAQLNRTFLYQVEGGADHVENGWEVPFCLEPALVVEVVAHRHGHRDVHFPAGGQLLAWVRGHQLWDDPGLCTSVW